MSPLYNSHDYYKKMLELQEKLRKSEEERVRLEERFNLLVQESRNRHDACLNRLRLRYIEFLEEQRARGERNNKLLETLNRVDTSLALMSAKTDRLNFLRKQYEVNLLRTYARPPGSVTGDSGIASHNEDRDSRQPNAMSVVIKVPPTSQIPQVNYQPIQPQTTFHPTSKFHASTRNEVQTRSIPRSDIGSPVLIHNQEQQTVQMQSGNNLASGNPRNYFQGDSNVQVQYPPMATLQTARLNQQNISPVNKFTTGGTDSIQNDARFAMDENSAYKQIEVINGQTISPSQLRYQVDDTSGGVNMRPVPQSQIFNTIGHPGGSLYGSVNIDSLKKLPPITPSSEQSSLKNFENKRALRRPSMIFKKNLELSAEDRTARILENELERYIGRIRNLHREVDTQSPEELDIEQNTSGDLLNVTLSDDGLDLPIEDKVNRMPEEVEKVLALADDLASRTVDPNEVDFIRNQKGELTKESSVEDQNRVPEVVRSSQGSKLVSDRIYDLPDINECEEEDAPAAPTKNGISGGIAPLRPELDRPHEDIRMPARPNWNSTDNPGQAESRTDEQATSKIQEDFADSCDRDEGEEKGGDAGNALEEKQLFIANEVEVEEDSFNIMEELEKMEPWDLKQVEKQIREVSLNEMDKDQSTEKQSNDIPKIHNVTEKAVDIKDFEGNNRNDDVINEAAESQSIESSFNKTSENNVNCEDGNLISEQIKVENHNSAPSKIEQITEMNETREREEHSEKEISQSDAEAANLNSYFQQELPRQDGQDNQEYDENQMQNYMQDSNQEYIDPNQQYEYDQNQGYDQEYVQGSAEQYDEYMGQQYEQYTGDPNLYDPNAQYEQNPDQYSYNYDQQYTNNGAYENDPGAQNYEYPENVPYESNEEYNVQNQEYVEQQEHEISEQPAQLPGDQEPSEIIGEKTNDQEDSENKIKEQAEVDETTSKKKKNVIKSLLDSDTESSIEKNVSNTESDFDFN